MEKETGSPKPGAGLKGFPGTREPIVAQCTLTGADGSIMKCRKVEDNFCAVFLSPAAKWRLGDCPMADDFLRSKKEQKSAGKTRVGQQKQRRK